MMTEMFERVFGEMCAEKNLAWYEVLDSEVFEIVTKNIANEMRCSVEELEENEEFSAWVSEMAEEL